RDFHVTGVQTCALPIYSPAPPLLATTPVHLRALVESGLALPPLAGIVSATAPLPRELAATAEARFGCEVREVFGSTETCVFARRSEERRVGTEGRARSA